MRIILALGRLMQEDLQLQASLGYNVCLEKEKENWDCVNVI
jgi:hypothetical protein